jgi:hypothetical protein
MSLTKCYTPFAPVRLHPCLSRVNDLIEMEHDEVRFELIMLSSHEQMV